MFSYASVTSGVPHGWAATTARPGVNLLTEISDASASRIAEEIKQRTGPEDLIAVSVHWGPNWGYEVPDEQRKFAHALINKAGVSIIHGHSSHHPKAIEVYRNRLILYGCGDFLNDYEGIRGYEEYRDDLVVMYFVDLTRTNGNVCGVELVPLQIRKFQLVRPSNSDIHWMQQTLDREYRKFGTSIAAGKDGHFVLSWRPYQVALPA